MAAKDMSLGYDLVANCQDTNWPSEASIKLYHH
jgi:hypothetical protein